MIESKTIDDLTIALWRENKKNNIERSDWNFRRVVDEKFEVGIEEINYYAVETSSKNLKVGRKSSTRSTSDSRRTTGVNVSIIRTPVLVRPACYNRAYSTRRHQWIAPPQGMFRREYFPQNCLKCSKRNVNSGIGIYAQHTGCAIVSS